MPRAKPIPARMWEEHKEELRDLYPKMTLEDLMVMMKVRYQFAPSYVPYSLLAHLTYLIREPSLIAPVAVSIFPNSRSGGFRNITKAEAVP